MRESRPSASVSIWHVDPRRFDDAWAKTHEEWLGDEERAEIARLRFAKHRREHLVTRVLGRWALCRATGVDPRAWRFSRTPHGRPYVVEPCVRAPEFNLANTEGLVVCALHTAAIGIDAEPWTRGDEILEIRRTVFSARELADLDALDAVSQQRRAVALWTLKEAYLKAVGTGLSAPVDQFSVILEGERPTVDFELDDDPARWQASLHTVGDHAVALFAEHSGATPLAVELARAPL